MNMHQTVMCNTYGGLLLTKTLSLSPALVLLNTLGGSQLISPTHTDTHIWGFNVCLVLLNPFHPCIPGTAV